MLGQSRGAQLSTSLSAGETSFFRPAQKQLRRVVTCARAELKKPDELKRPDANRPRPQSDGNAPSSSGQQGVTLEYQRQQAKALQTYFRDLKDLREYEKRKVFGWTPKNEITNGRWVMMGIGIGLLTEYATGVDFPNQLKLMLSYLGIADIYE